MLCQRAGCSQPLERVMRTFVNHENVVRYCKLIMIAEADPSRDEARYQTLLRLLAEEEAKEVPPSIGLPHP